MSRFPVLPPRLAVVLAALSLLAYSLLFELFYRLIGAGVAALATVPVVTIGWLWGTRAGLLAGLLSFPLNTFLLNQVGYQPGGWAVVIHGGGGPGSVVLVLIGLFAGRMHDLTETGGRELAERRRAEQTLADRE